MEALSGTVEQSRRQRSSTHCLKCSHTDAMVKHTDKHGYALLMRHKKAETTDQGCYSWVNGCAHA